MIWALTYLKSCLEYLQDNFLKFASFLWRCLQQSHRNFLTKGEGQESSYGMYFPHCYYLDDYLPPIFQRLDPTFHGFGFRGRDVFVIFENQRYLFWLKTGELPETLLDITFRISGNLVRLNRRGRRRQRIRGCEVNVLTKCYWRLCGWESIHA